MLHDGQGKCLRTAVRQLGEMGVMGIRRLKARNTRTGPGRLSFYAIAVEELSPAWMAEPNALSCRRIPHLGPGPLPPFWKQHKSKIIGPPV